MGLKESYRLALERLLEGCPKPLTQELLETHLVTTLRHRRWLSPAAFRALYQGLQRCNLQQLLGRYGEASDQISSGFSLPPVIPWSELDMDHILYSGQVFRLQEAPHEKLFHIRRSGMQVIRQGKVGVVLLAGGGNFRLGGEVVCCNSRLLDLRSKKSLLQLYLERLARVAQTCVPPEETKQGLASPAIPVFILTSCFTKQAIRDHLEANRYFGYSERDIMLIDQPVSPILDDHHQLLPQSLTGDFAQSPGGSGQLLDAMVTSTALEQCKDRGVECLHILGTENLLAKVCDPVFIGFCRELEVDCACKITQRQEVREDMDLFCVRKHPICTQYADAEDCAFGVHPSQAPVNLLESRNALGQLSYFGCMNSFFMTVAYMEHVVQRQVRLRSVPRAVPYLDFHTFVGAEHEPAPCERDVVVATASEENSIPLGSWPHVPSMLGSSQKELLAAAAEIRERAHAQGQSGPWRAEVDLDSSGKKVVRVETAEPCTVLPASMMTMDLEALETDTRLRCSLVVPSEANAHILESSLLEYFMYTDRAVALQVPRNLEYAPIHDPRGPYSAEAAREALSELHQSWVLSAGATFDEEAREKHVQPIEVSPLLSYEGEGLGGGTLYGIDLDGTELTLPCHLRAPEEESSTKETVPEAFAPQYDNLDTRQFYLEEYPNRPQITIHGATRCHHRGAGFADLNAKLGRRQAR